VSEGAPQAADQAAAPAADAAEPIDPPDLTDLQGNLIGFNKDNQRFVFLQFSEQASAQAFLRLLEPHVASALEVKRFNDLFHEIHTRRHGASDIIQASWTNLALSAAGLQLLGAPGLDTFPQEFRDGMAARAEAIGDVDDSAPGGWIAPFSAPQSIHAVAILAADQIDDLGRSHQRLRDLAAENGVTELFVQEGVTRPIPFRGHEHFGFKDGISQPAIAGVTRSNKHGTDAIAAGEFIVGYPDQDGVLSGQPEAPAPEGTPGYNPVAPPPPPAPIADWSKDGSFVVFRRLRQNVAAFNSFVEQQAGGVGLNPDQLGAKLMGRWKSGAPLERTVGQDADVDPTAADPAAADPNTELVDDRHINDFDYAEDQDGHLVPHAAHIRKANPRSAEPPGKAESSRHRILRRGIPYGPEFVPGEPAYPGAGVPPPDDQDRGLIFVCYQSSIARGFEFIQSQWVNNNDFTQAGDGRDPIISQDTNPRDFHLTPQDVHLSIERWVQTTGGEYFFSPSLSALRQLAGAVDPPGAAEEPQAAADVKATAPVETPPPA
jgi:Dyp-type peroxidase family